MSTPIAAAKPRHCAARLIVSAAVTTALAGGFTAHADQPASAGSQQALVLAQANNSPAAGPSPTTPAKADDTVQEVVVTGSRIVRRDYDSQSPIVTVPATTFENTSSIGLESTLDQLPQFNPSGNQSALSPAQNPFPSATATPGAATLDLRALGVNRTLVLLDGQRAQPVNATLAIDLNTIPAAAIDSVETITGGAASTYGADAIAGVVNFKLKRNFEGAQIDAQTGISQYGDDQENTVSALMGTNFADNKGNIMMALSWAKRGGVDGTSRPWVRDGWNDPGTLGGGPPLPQFSYSATNMPTNGSWIGPSPTYYIDQNGNVFDVNNPQNPAHPYTGPLGGSSGYKINPNGSLGWNNEQYDPLQIPMTRWSAFASGHYDFTDHVSLFAKLTYSQTKTSYESAGYSQLGNIWAVTVPYNEASDDPASPTFGQVAPGGTFHPVPAGLAALLNARPVVPGAPAGTTGPDSPWTYNGPLNYIGGFAELNTSDVYQATLGFSGDIPNTDSTWTIFGSHGETNGVEEQPNGYPNLTRIQELFNYNLYGQGFSNSYPIAVTGHCTSGLPIFSPTGGFVSNPTISTDCANWILMRMNTITQLTQQVGEADIQGGLFEMPFGAGRLRYAFGVDYRSEDFNFNPDSGYNANQDTPVVVQNIALPVAVQGHTSVSEAYTEFSIPVVKDLPFVKSFEIDPGYRYSRYNTAGGVNTFKVMGDWNVTSWVKIRGGLEVANRAPNIAELFTPIGGSQLTGISGVTTPDPCAVYSITPSWGNNPANPNRLNVQALCQYLITRQGGPASIMVPGASANNYMYDVFGYTPTPFPYSIAITQGNPNLKSEVARTLTWGAVLHAPWDSPLVSKMSLSVDWYDIVLKGAIGIPGFNTVYQECLDAQYNNLVGRPYGSVTGAQMAANNPYCALINREYVPGLDPYGADRNYNAEYINQGGIKSSGTDVEFDWTVSPSDMRVPVPGALSLNVIGSYLKEYAESPFAGAAYIDYTGTEYNNSFRYKLYTTLSYAVGPVSAGLRWTHLPSVAPPPGSAAGELGVDSHSQFDLFARWAITDALELRGGVDNLFNTWPEWVGAIPGTNNAIGTTNENYDTIGRRFYLGLKAKF